MRRLNVFIFFVLSFTQIVSAQIGKPMLGFTQACASPSFNTYNVTFTFSSDIGSNASNQFEIELSDENGDFSTASTIYVSEAGSVTVSPATLTFSLPTTTSGEGYEIKIKSTEPAVSSTASDAFAAYYKIQDSPFTINNLIATGSYCSSGSYLLTIDNPGDDKNDSPLKYESLTFKWFKETGPSTSVFVDYGNTLEVDSPGIYFVETNYGTCTSNSYSNRVTIDEVELDASTFTINSSLEIPYCASDGPTILTAIKGDTYQWFLDDVEITGATEQMYTTNVEGTYLVNVSLGSCSSSATIDLVNTDFTASIDVPEYNDIEANETLEINVTTTATDPQFNWYLDKTSVATGISYEATESGNYTVEVLQTTGCVSTKTFSFEVNKKTGTDKIDPFPDVEQIPNIISPNNDGENDTWVIPKIYVSGTNAKVLIFSPQGKIVFKTDDYQNNWPINQIEFKSINPVYYYIITTENNEIHKGSITVIR
ncbi:gliding motility-associated C-terminal domain-containing protein [Algibacter sp. L1A34]|uniref:T9SS type B sorting domain-containing protein n=1 Tax=Algibacter sp. L1A34 TaxID=2686365 RepID=UPI00131D622A|nr:gliding motility-associated C-terminal domain-containing protein [Algibacter sp. L1A34]